LALRMIQRHRGSLRPAVEDVSGPRRHRLQDARRWDDLRVCVDGPFPAARCGFHQQRLQGQA
jgi:hypothetical protein